MEQLTTILAVWGAVLSTIAILWNFYRDVSNRGRLRVTCYIGNLIGGEGPRDPTDYLIWSVTNVGRQPLFVTHIGGKLKVNEFFVTTRVQLPKMLQPGEYFVDYARDLSALKPDLRELGAWDSLGRFYGVPRWQVRKLKREHLRAR